MRYCFRSLALMLGVIAGLQFARAEAEKRVALVIGNSAYRHTRALPNPRNDAEAIARLLRNNGFAEVILKSDLDYRAMRMAVRLFGASARAADVALVYYAGHGLEVAGENFLVPIDARLERDADLEYEAVTLASVLGSVEGARKLRLVILDACRNNPLGDKMAIRAGRTRSVTRGLARLEPTGEVLVAYAAKAGTLALDGAGQHSPYAEALLSHMATPGLDVIRMLGRVKEAVLKATDRAQEPWIYGSPGGDIIALVPGKGAGAPPPAASAVFPPSEAALEWSRVDKTSIAELETFERRHGASAEAEYARARLKELRKQPLDEAERIWATVKDTNSTRVLDAFVSRFGHTIYGALARARLEELKNIQATLATPASPPNSATSVAQREWASLNKSSAAALEGFVRTYDGRGEADYEVEYARGLLEQLRRTTTPAASAKLSPSANTRPPPVVLTAAQREWASLNKYSISALERFVRRHATTAEVEYEVEYARTRLKLLRSGALRARR